MIHFNIKSLYLKGRFFVLFSAIMLLFIVGFFIPFLFPIAQTLLIISTIFSLVDYMFLFHKKCSILGERTVAKILSLGDENKITINIQNLSSQKLQVRIIDELPFQLQERTFEIVIPLESQQKEAVFYNIKPLKRGAYKFGILNIFARTRFGLVERRFELPLQKDIPVYPSVIQMKKFEFRAFSNISRFEGIKKIRKLGHNYEFEQIRNYVIGDDYRSVNWKATARKADLMVNQYEDEKSQQVYCVIDKSRSMRLPFEGLSLLDYAINTSLVISNVSLLKHDKAGLLTFSDKIGTLIKAERKKSQLRGIMNALYKEKERDAEASYDLLYLASRNMIKGRSLLFLFSNFESHYALERALPVLRKLNKRHLLVVIFFENSEIANYSKEVVKDMEDIYLKTVAQKYEYDKRQMIQKLAQFGIQAILTQPSELSLNAVNKYLELKARGMI